MASAKVDPQVLAHREWLGFVGPSGLVFSATALVRAGAILNRNDAEGQQLLRALIGEGDFADTDGPEPFLPDFRGFAEQVLGWRFGAKGYAGTADAPIPEDLMVALPEYGETLRPDFAVREPEPKDGSLAWQLLVRVLEPGQGFDTPEGGHGKLEASAHGRMERLLRHTGAPAGLLFNGRALRLISAPRGESSGWLDFKLRDMLTTAGRPMVAAMRLLLGQSRLLTLPRAQRLTALLGDSRKYQNEVTERLAEQVLRALYELLRGFQAAHDASGGTLLRGALAAERDAVYEALLTVILRLVFLLYAEERDLLPGDETWLRYYALGGLYERLREDAALYPDTMDQRYGAWAQLLALFRMVHDGAAAGSIGLPRRYGALFDPDREGFGFLEGRAMGDARQKHERMVPPLVPDGTIYRALEDLLVLDGERIAYRSLDVEQIGSVYETMMGFKVEAARGPSLAVKAPKKHGAPAIVNLAALLEQPSDKRVKWLKEATDREVTGKTATALRAADSLAALHAALEPVVDKNATPDLVPAGAMVLQPTAQRRQSGSHYTPRALTEPIVRRTLEPILEGLRGDGGRPPLPEQLLDLKVCDPAMGSGAFLVEACRQLGDALVASWQAHDAMPAIPPDEDALIFARRLVAQRCLYGVDRNAMAVVLSKVSLWLFTMAKDHALTFLDHALRHGDSLVGLSRRQIEAFHWDPSLAASQRTFVSPLVEGQIAKVLRLRSAIRSAGEGTDEAELHLLLKEADEASGRAERIGDLVVVAFFSADTKKARERRRLELAEQVRGWLLGAAAGDAAAGDVGEPDEMGRAATNEAIEAEAILAEVAGSLQQQEHRIQPFHWELEFPEVFERKAAGFDAVLGNPPFAGKNTMAAGNHAQYPDWLKAIHPGSHGNADLVAHFYRLAFDRLAPGGCFGLIATNTIAQGDTRNTGLTWIRHHGGTIYAADRRVRWPGQAAVIVSVVHVRRGEHRGTCLLDGRPVDRITAFLFHAGGDDDPPRLAANAGKSFQGSIILGMGFTFDDTDKEGKASTIAEMRRLIADNLANQEVIFPYIGGEEVNTSPTHTHHRYVINFGERGEVECRERWPELMQLVEERVRPERMKLSEDNQDGRNRKKHWWRWGRYTPALFEAIRGKGRVLVCAQTSTYRTFCMLPAGSVYDQKLVVFPFDTFAVFAALQAQCHLIWALFFGSSLEDRPVYTPSDCFETFPFSPTWETDPALKAAGEECYTHRARLMVDNDEGLTKTYKRFHDPDETSAEIHRLRELHAAMDRTVLDAYGWTDIPTDCEFLLDYEVDEEERGRKRLPWRYRWPDAVRDEVLARLLALNAERAAEESRVVAAVGAGQAVARTTGKAKRAATGMELLL